MTAGQKFVADWAQAFAPEDQRVIATVIDDAVRVEREECAKIADAVAVRASTSDVDTIIAAELCAEGIARAIRHRNHSKD